MRLDNFETRVSIFSVDGMLLPHVWVTTFECEAEPVPGDKMSFTVVARPVSSRLVEVGGSSRPSSGQTRRGQWTDGPPSSGLG